MPRKRGKRMRRLVDFHTGRYCMNFLRHHLNARMWKYSLYSRFYSEYKYGSCRQVKLYTRCMMFDVIIFDWKRTLYDPDAKALIEGAQEILEYFKNKNTPMILVGKGGDDMNAEVERLGVRKYFSDIIFAEGEKDPNVYVPYIPKDDPTKAVFIGDSVRSELEI